MPNSKLQDKYFKVPDNVFNIIKRMLTQINSTDGQAKGLKRANDMVSDRKISYSQMKRLKNYFDSYEGDGNDDEYKLIGGKATRIWVDKTLGHDRDSIKHGKKVRKDAGEQNQFIKTHTKDKDNSDPTDPNGGMVDITKSSKMRNIMANDAIYKSSDRKSEAYNKEIDSMKYLIEYMSKN
jgi:hypothetical protein